MEAAAQSLPPLSAWFAPDDDSSPASTELIRSTLDQLSIPYASDVLAFFELTQGRLGQYPDDIVEFLGLEDMEYYQFEFVKGPKDILFFADVCIASHFVGFRKRSVKESDVVVYIGENEPLHVVAESAHEFIRGLATEDSARLLYPGLVE